MIARNTIRPVITICTLCSVIGFAAGAAAADRASAADIIGGKASSRDIKPIFEHFDENRDQRVDRTEFRVWIVGAFEMLDEKLRGEDFLSKTKHQIYLRKHKRKFGNGYKVP